MKTGHVTDLSARQLLAVLAVAENGSFVGAAAQLQVSQPALTRPIKRVEDVLGVGLFERTTRQVRLTDAGREFVALAQRVTNDLRIAADAMREIADQQRGQVIVACLMSVAHGVLPRAIGAYRQTRPGIEIQVRDGIHSDVLEDVKSGAADFGITYLDGVPEGLLATRLGLGRFDLVARRGSRFDLLGLQAIGFDELRGVPLVIVNGPIASEIGMDGGANAFGSGNRANATIGRAIRLIMLNVDGGRAPDLDKCTLGNPAKYSYAICEHEAASPFAPYHVEQGYAANTSMVFALAAEAPHSVTDHQCNDPEGILDTIISAMSTIASNKSVLSGHCALALGLEHARTIAKYGWTRHDIKSYLWMHSGSPFRTHSRDHRYGKVYNRNLPRWYKRGPDDRIPVVESPDRIHLFVIGGDAGRFSAFIPGWGI